jgi:acetylornithine deacetylase/succinyl-diaminopimelate desuccinylase-like protein
MAAVHNDRAAARPTGSDAAFSATAARAVLERVYPDATPHPIGSPANAAVRDRIVAELEALGAAPTIQRTVSCRGPVCGVVDNIVAVVRGRHPSPAVLLAVHYDSVPAGPGIGARARRDHPDRRR